MRGSFHTIIYVDIQGMQKQGLALATMTNFALL